MHCYTNCTSKVSTVKTKRRDENLFTLDYRDARPIYTQICDNIREQILTGVLQHGDKLPSVRELATLLTINPNTIQRSYRQLEMEGWIASVAGKGSFVSGVPSSLEADRALLWEELDKLLQRFAYLGVDNAQIIHHMEEGGNKNA